MTEYNDDFDKELAQRAAESYARKDDTGKFRGILKESEGIQMWRPGEGSHIFDIVPYRTGKHDPRLPEGSLTYVLDIWVHYNVGATEDSFVCPARTYSDKKNPLHTAERCPICETQNELRKELDKLEDEEQIKAMEDKIKSLNPRRRVLYNVLVLDSAAEEEKGVQVWDVAHWSMERHLSVLSEKRRGPSGATVGGHIPFASPKTGKSIVFQKKGKGMNTEFIGHRFEDRQDYEITKELLEMARCLDEEINIPIYDDLYLAHHGVMPGEPRPETVKPSPEPDIPSEGAGDQAAPTGRRFRTPVQQQFAQPNTKEPIAQESTENECKSGGIFGKDTDKLPGCKECEEALWERCARLLKASEEAAAKEVAPADGERRLRRNV